MKFGIFIGRCQPFHKGHQEIINEILLDGLTPIVVLGSSNSDRDLNKNPLSFVQRMELIRLVYPNVPIVFIKSEDYTSWDTWYYHVVSNIKSTIKEDFEVNPTKNDMTLYHHNKEEDRSSFYFHGKEYTNTFYSEIFSNDFQMKQVEFPEREDLIIKANARDIRHNVDNMKHLLDARVYWRFKEMTK